MRNTERGNSDAEKLPWRIASRLNSFRGSGIGVADAIRQMALIDGVSALELNYPQHLLELREGELDRLLDETGLLLTALNLRLEGRVFAQGAFTSPDSQVRAEAVNVACSAVELAERHGANHVVLWMADDGWDYPFQAEYAALWERKIECFRTVADQNSDIRVSVEYKPREPRAFSLIRSMGDALLAVQDVNRPNFGVTIDICHSYMAGEHPPAAAAAALRRGKLFGVHLNDGYGTADDGLMIGSVHQRDTLEFLYVLRAAGYSGTVYFDTFPVREEPAAELAANIAALEHFWGQLNRLDEAALQSAGSAHDGIAVSHLMLSQ